jgi:putative ABC transport system permease protein
VDAAAQPREVDVTATDDVRGALRQLKARPLFALLVTTTLGLSLGLATTAFSLFDAILLRPLPFPESERLVRVQTFSTQAPQSLHGASLPDFEDWERRVRSLAPMAVWVTMQTHLTEEGPARTVRTTFATPRLFEALGVRPILGRTFREDENVHGGDLRKVVLGYGFWREVFGASPDVIGRQIQMRGRPHEVIGVLPPRFDYPDRTQAWMPLMGRYGPSEVWWRRRDLYSHGVIGRLQTGITFAQAQAEMDTVAQTLASEHPSTNRHTRIRLQGLRQAELGPLGAQVSGVTAAAVLLLLLACVNVGGLFVARAAGRMQEFAVRTALGAEPLHVFRQQITEGLLYGVIGGATGVAVASIAIPAVRALIPIELPTWMQFELDGRSLVFAASAGLATMCVILATTLTPHAPRNVASALRQGEKGNVDAFVSARMRRLLIAVQVALSVVLLVGTGLTVRSLLQLGRVDTGIQTHGVLVASVAGDIVPTLTREQAIPRHARGFTQMRDALAELPGVETVSAGTTIPFLNAPEQRPVYELYSRRRATPETAYHGALRTSSVMPGYFTTLGVRILEGRDFTQTDTLDAPPVAIISQRAGELLFPGEHPLGLQIRWGVNPYFWATIVGIVPNTTWHQVDDGGIEFYFSHAQFPAETMRFLISTKSDPALLASAVRSTLESVNPNYVVERIVPFDHIKHDALWQRRLWTCLFIAFGTVAVALTCVGLFAVMSYLVTQRRREFGVRVALGATRGDIVGVVLNDGGRIALIGTVCGLVVAMAISRYLEALLFRVSRFDLVTFASVPVIVGVVVLVACAWPAWRASRVDPLVALRDSA